MVRANSENRRPTSPCRKAIGTNTATSTTVVATTAKADLAGAAVGRNQPRLAVFLHAAVDVLQHHDGVVHHQADGQHQRQQGDDVDGETQRQQHAERGDQRHRHRDRRHQHGAHTAEEQVDHRDHQAMAMPSVLNTSRMAPSMNTELS